MNDNANKYKNKFRNCEDLLKKKLFLTSNDLITVNITNRIVFQIFILCDFIFLIYFPLYRIYFTSGSATSQISSQTNTDELKNFTISEQSNTSQASSSFSNSTLRYLDQRGLDLNFSLNEQDRKDLELFTSHLINQSDASSKNTAFKRNLQSFEKADRKQANIKPRMRQGTKIEPPVTDNIEDDINILSNDLTNSDLFDSIAQQMEIIIDNLNPAEKLFRFVPISVSLFIEIFVIIIITSSMFLLIALILSRERSQLNISSQRKIVNKIAGLLITLNKFFFFVPFLTFGSKIFLCNYVTKEECLSGTNLIFLILAIIMFILQLIMVFYSTTMMTSFYPNETIPWSHFPSKLPYFKILFQIATILVYEGDQNGSIIMYVNILFSLSLLIFTLFRLIKAQTFDRGVQNMYLYTESIGIIIYFVAFLSDAISIKLSNLFSTIFFLTIVAFVYCVNLVKCKAREIFLKKIDIFNYTYEDDALHMMVALHELIESSQFDSQDEFLLRGFIERHIEICDFPQCNCLEYYRIINSAYRIQLATVATIREDESTKLYNSGTGTATVNRSQTNEDETTTDDQSMAKTFFVQSKNMVKQNKKKTKFLNGFLINNIKVFLELFPFSIKLRYMSAFIYFNLFKNSFKALYELSFTKTLKSTFGEQYDSYTLELKIVNYFDEKVNTYLSQENKILDLEIDLKQIIEFENLNIIYQKKIEQTSDVAGQFWLELNKKNINVENIFKLGCDITQQFHDIKKKYKKLMSINNNYLEVAYLYKLFVSLCLNYDIEEREAKMEITKILQIKGMKKKNIKQDYCKINFQDENGMIIISGCQKDFSKILAMNNKAERIFGYNTSELIAHSLSKLQPIAYGNSHDEFILNYINSKRKIKKEVHNFIWGKHKSGFVMPLIMDISPYVTFDYNLCFISFCKRSVLLEMNPLKEILDAQDVFVLIADQRGMITDMTRNLTEWLGFPLQALNKEMSLEQIFDGILEDEFEKEFQEGKKIEFQMNSFKDALDDFDNRSEDELESTLYIKEKKCRALVWMKIAEHQLSPSTYIKNNQVTMLQSNMAASLGGQNQNLGLMTTHQGPSLIVREVWFVLLEDDTYTATVTASFIDTRNTHESEQKEEQMKYNFQEEREEICSLASVSSLTGYQSGDQGLINKLSEIKASTIDESKPRSISILQKSLFIVFILSIVSAIVILALFLQKNQSFYSNLDKIFNAKMSSIYFQNLQILTREIVNIANQDQNDTASVLNSNQSLHQDLMDILYDQTDLFRIYQQSLDNENTVPPRHLLDYKEKNHSLTSITQNGGIYLLEKTVYLVFYEIMTICQDMTQIHNISAFSLDRTILQNSETFQDGILLPKRSKKQIFSNQQISLFYILSNSFQPNIAFHPLLISNEYIESAYDQVGNYSVVFYSITFIAIAITLMTTAFIIPIILRIESNKEKVFFIYAELEKNDIDDRKRDIQVFFAKLRQSTNNPGGSLFQEKSSRVVSSRLLTKKFSLRDENQQNTHEIQELFRQGQISKNAVFGLSNDLSSNRASFRQGGFVQSNDEIEEDMRAEMIKQQEDLNQQIFKKFFHKKIKQMGCIKKLKYILMILLISGLVSGYFVMINEIISGIQTQLQSSLTQYQIIAQRDVLFTLLIVFYRESVSRNETIFIEKGDINFHDSNNTLVNSIDFFVNQVLDNEQLYNALRQDLPKVLNDASNLINEIESDQLCSVIKETQEIEECQTAMDGILTQGMTQTINTMVMQIIQSQIDFEQARSTNLGLKKIMDTKKIRNLIYLKFLYLDQSLEQLILAAKDSIKNYFKSQEKNLIIVFNCFLVFMLIGVIVSTTYGMNFLFKNFNATKSILNLIPGKNLLELSEKADLKKIQF